MLKNKQNPLLMVQNLKSYFPKEKGLFSNKVEYVKAVDNVSLSIYKGETFGLVGESGSGKTTLGKTILRLIEPTEGEIILDGENITHLSSYKLRLRRKKMQMIFQDPYSSLHPRMTAKQIIAEPLQIHHMLKKHELDKTVYHLMEIVGLASYQKDRYPHEFSGGQRQRIGIARALALKPKLIICDEAVSALDVSIQSQILNLLNDLQKEFEMAYLFITHDIAVVQHVSNRIGVMYLGSLVEVADSSKICRNPKHPYTQALISAIPIPDPGQRTERIILEGDVPSPLNPPLGCCFHPRCRYAMPICKEEKPPLVECDEEHYVACHMWNILNTEAKT